MFNKIFNNKAQEIAEPKSRMTFSGRPSPKNKNTYIIADLRHVMAQAELFELCKNTPLPIVKLNGQELNKGGWMHSTNFPNPAAHQLSIEQKCPEFHAIMGSDLACTIIVYNDKQTHEPVLWLFPNGDIMVEDYVTDTDLTKYLNHAQRKDLNHQLKLRRDKQKLMAPLIESRNAALRNAPRTRGPEFYTFMDALDQQQMIAAQKILDSVHQK